MKLANNVRVAGSTSKTLTIYAKVRRDGAIGGVEMDVESMNCSLKGCIQDSVHI
jgi:hypothetical protein